MHFRHLIEDKTANQTTPESKNQTETEADGKDLHLTIRKEAEGTSYLQNQNDSTKQQSKVTCQTSFISHIYTVKDRVTKHLTYVCKSQFPCFLLCCVATVFWMLVMYSDRSQVHEHVLPLSLFFSFHFFSVQFIQAAFLLHLSPQSPLPISLPSSVCASLQ